MKHWRIFIGLLSVAVLTSCRSTIRTEQQSSLSEETQIYQFEDSCQHLVLKVSVELPTGNDSISECVRDSLLSVFADNMRLPGYGSDQTPTSIYSGPKDDIQALVNYYAKAAYHKLLTSALADYEERMMYLQTDTTLSAEDRQMIEENTPQWEYDLTVQKMVQTPIFAVYRSQGYMYCGGAHGGVVGAGSLTFDCRTGCKIDRFVDPSAVQSMQPLLRKGLMQFYQEGYETFSEQDLNEHLQIEGTLIPLPQQTAYPNAAGDSLTFTYGQYEIACYADGMPSFSLSVAEVAPYLTDEGRALLMGTDSEH